MRHYHKQSGNILFLILIAATLFGALTYAVSSSSRTGSTSHGSESTLLASSDLTQYAGAVAHGITTLRVSNRCSDDEISFERSPFDGSDADYINTNARNDFSCHVFHPNGGRVSSRPPPPNTNDGSDWTYSEIVVLGMGADQTDCGANCSDLTLILNDIHKGTCEKINEKITGKTSIPVQDDGENYQNYKFTGSFNGNVNIDGDASSARTLCIQATDGTYYYYNVVLPR